MKTFITFAICLSLATSIYGQLPVVNPEIEIGIVEKLAETIGEDKDREVVVYCRSGKRSGKAKKSLEEHGYKNVHNGFGYEGLKKARDKTG